MRRYIHTRTLLETEQVTAETAKQTVHAAHTQTEYRGTGTCDVVPVKEPSILEEHNPDAARKSGQQSGLQQPAQPLPGQSQAALSSSSCSYASGRRSELALEALPAPEASPASAA